MEISFILGAVVLGVGLLVGGFVAAYEKGKEGGQTERSELLQLFTKAQDDLTELRATLAERDRVIEAMKQELEASQATVRDLSTRVTHLESVSEQLELVSNALKSINGSLHLAGLELTKVIVDRHRLQKTILSTLRERVEHVGEPVFSSPYEGGHARFKEVLAEIIEARTHTSVDLNEADVSAILHSLKARFEEYASEGNRASDNRSQ